MPHHRTDSRDRDVAHAPVLDGRCPPQAARVGTQRVDDLLIGVPERGHRQPGGRHGRVPGSEQAAHHPRARPARVLARPPTLRVPAAEPRLGRRRPALEPGPAAERGNHPLLIPPRPAGGRGTRRLLMTALAAVRPPHHPVAAAVTSRGPQILADGVDRDIELRRYRGHPDTPRVHPQRRVDPLVQRELEGRSAAREPRRQQRRPPGAVIARNRRGLRPARILSRPLAPSAPLADVTRGPVRHRRGTPNQPRPVVQPLKHPLGVPRPRRHRPLGDGHSVRHRKLTIRHPPRHLQHDLPGSGQCARNKPASQVAREQAAARTAHTADAIPAAGLALFWSELVTLWQEEPRSTRSYQVSDRVNAASARPAALARHYRDRASLTIAEIVRRLGRADDAAKAYLCDLS